MFYHSFQDWHSRTQSMSAHRKALVMINLIAKAHGWGGEHLRVFHPRSEEWNVARWTINGFPARVIVWTSDEWERLEARPLDAQYLPCGVWCAIRVDE